MKRITLDALKIRMAFFVLIVLSSCGNNSIQTNEKSSSNETQKGHRTTIDEPSNNDGIVSCGNIKLYRKQINHIYLCIESDSKINDEDSIELDLSGEDLSGWTIYLDNRTQCGNEPMLCSELDQNRSSNDCSKKLLPVKGTMNVLRKGKKLMFTFSETKWEMDGVKLSQTASQFSVDLND